MLELTVTGLASETRIQAGDAVDLGINGIVVWFSEPEAEAYRVFLRASQQRVRDAIEFTKSKYENEDRSPTLASRDQAT